MRTNYVELCGSIHKLWLKDNVGTIILKVTEEYKGSKKDTFVNCVCFGKNLSYANNLHEGDQVECDGRIGKKKNKEDQWELNIVLNNLQKNKEYANQLREMGFN